MARPAFVRLRHGKQDGEPRARIADVNSVESCTCGRTLRVAEDFISLLLLPPVSGGPGRR